MSLAPFVFPHVHACDGAAPRPTKLHSYSQGAEDVTLWTRFFEPAGVLVGTFLEIGALDGSGLSNTLMFEEQLGWRGVLVEAVPSNSIKLHRAGLERRRRSATFGLGSCGDPRAAPWRQGTLTVLAGGGPMGAVEMNDTAEHITLFGMNSETRQAVACLPLQAMLEAAGLLDIDLFSLDVEGAEAVVLGTLDLSVTNVRLVLVEANGLNADKDERVRAALRGAGFERGFDVREGCPGRENCMENEVWINPAYEARRRARILGLDAAHRFHLGTGLACDQAVSRAAAL